MVYICAVEGLESGGPELLHQLAFVLNQLNVKTKMAYLANGFPIRIVPSQVIPLYGDYVSETEFDMEVMDRGENIVVIPEIAFDLVEQFQYATKVAWWMSVDNYRGILQREYGFSDEEMQTIECLDYYNFRNRNDVIHLAQSYYAVDFLHHDMQVDMDNIGYLSDYINDSYFKMDFQTIDNERKNIVLFNPKKGGERLKKLIDATAGEIGWVPLENLTREKMQLYMMIAKVYVDFGNHPGKDRIPREAAISGCCVITGMHGAAKFHEDVPIPNKYKVDDLEDLDVSHVRDLILDIFEHYDERIDDFEEYRTMIRGEKEKFIKDAMNLFCI